MCDKFHEQYLSLKINHWALYYRQYWSPHGAYDQINSDAKIKNKTDGFCLAHHPVAGVVAGALPPHICGAPAHQRRYRHRSAHHVKHHLKGIDR